MAASPGQFGGLRSLQHLRQVLMALGCWLVPTVVTVPRAAQAFDDRGQPAEEALARNVERLVDTLLERV